MIFILTGCEGFIGHHMAEYLLRAGHYVVGIDKLTYASKQFYENRKSEGGKEYSRRFLFMKEDIKDLKKIPDCDCIINFAAESHVDNSIESSNEFLNSNVLGVQNLLRLASQKYRKPLFVQISTDEVYGECESGSITEESLLFPGNPYAASKAAADMLVKAWAKTYGLDYQIIRPSNNYGFYQHPEKFIPRIIKSYLCGAKIELHNDGTPIRTWLNVQDTCGAVFSVINSKKKNEIYNISSLDVCSNLHIVKTIFEILNKEYKYYDNIEGFLDYGYKRPGQDVRYNVDDTKLRNLGWKNQVSLEEELPKLVKNYCEYFKFYGVIF